MSFLANETVTAAPPESVNVANDGFFPDIDLAKLREVVRLDGTVTDVRLRQAVIEAIININPELADWKDLQLAAGIATLDAMTPRIDGTSYQQQQYLVAIYRTVKADLNEKFSNFDATKSGVDEAERLQLIIDTERRLVRLAIRQILGRRQTTVELI